MAPSGSEQKTTAATSQAAWPGLRLLRIFLSAQLVGLDRLERSTSPLSGVRSNHLSYRPESFNASRPAHRFGDRPAGTRPAQADRDRAASAPKSVLVREERET
jgi:hypothetical protein